MGLVTTIAAFYFLKRDLKSGKLNSRTGVTAEPVKETTDQELSLLSQGQKRFFALFIPLMFALDVAAMSILNLQGGDATALIGGTSVFILLLITMVSHKNKGLEKQLLI